MSAGSSVHFFFFAFLIHSSSSTHPHHLGIPFFNVTPPQLAIAEASQAILGDFLLGLQAGNEPDLYSAHNHRPSASSLSTILFNRTELTVCQSDRLMAHSTTSVNSVR